MSMHPRRRSNDGVMSHTERAMPLRQSLVYAVLGETKRAPPPRMQTLHCDKRALGAPAGKLTDAQMLHVRALREFRGLTARQIVLQTGYPKNTVASALKFENRVHLQPTAAHLAKPEA